jgi:hypothetical protein
MKGAEIRPDEAALPATPVLPCRGLETPCMGGPGTLCAACPIPPRGWMAMPDGTCQPAPEPPSDWTAARAACADLAPPAVSELTRRIALHHAADMLAPTSSGAQLVAAAYLIGRFLDTGRA